MAAARQCSKVVLVLPILSNITSSTLISSTGLNTYGSSTGLNTYAPAMQNSQSTKS